MTQKGQFLSQSHSFLPLNSVIDVKLPNFTLKRLKTESQPKQKSMLYQQLLKVSPEDTKKKRQSIIKYLKREGDMKNTSELIKKIQKEGHAIPILQVAIALSGYDNQFLKELLDFKTIEQKEAKQEELYELNKKLQSDPILSLLSDSEQLRLPNQQKQPSFIDYKFTSPEKKHDLIDYSKGKLKKFKIKTYGNVEYPKQLQKLKKQLFSLPHIKEYKKKMNSRKNQKCGKSCKSQIKEQPTKISELKSLNQSFGTIQKKIKKLYQREIDLENSLEQALKFRKSKIEVSDQEGYKPFSNINISKQVNQNSQSNRKMFETIISKDKTISSAMKNTIKSTVFNPQDDDQLSQRSFEAHNQMRNQQQAQYWPLYQKFSPHNKKYVYEIEKLKQKIRSFTELSQIPSEQTLSMYSSLKNLEAKDLKKLEQQAFQQQKAFSNTKYKIKYKNIKQSYSKRLKDFLKDRKVRQFQLQQHALEQKSHFVRKAINFNDKLLEKMNPQRN